jgi:hypothetical protein
LYTGGREGSPRSPVWSISAVALVTIAEVAAVLLLSAALAASLTDRRSG